MIRSAPLACVGSLVLLVGAAVACKSESNVTHDRSDAVEVGPEPKKPWLDPGAGPDGLTRAFAGSIADLPDPPLPELIEHLPGGRPVELSEYWAWMEGAGVPHPYVQRCVTSGYAVEPGDLAALIEAASARGWDRLDREDTIDFFDPHDDNIDRFMPLRINRAIRAAGRPIPPENPYMQIMQCKRLELEPGLREFQAHMRSDWRFIPIQQLAHALAHEAKFLHFGRRGERVFAGGTVSFESSDGAVLSQWIDGNGFVRNEQSIEAVIGEGFEVTLSFAGWDGGGICRVTTTAP